MKPIIVILAALLLATFALVGSVRSTWADILNDIFQVQCFPELDLLEVRQLHINGGAAQKAIAQPDHQLEKAYGIYAPQWHDYEGTSWDERESMDLRTRIECPLSTGTSTITILPELLPRRSLGRYSISVSIAVAGRVIVDDVPLVLCDRGGPIDSIVYNASEGYVVLKGQFGGRSPRPADPRRGGEKDNRRVFFLRDDSLLSAQAEALGWLVWPLPLRETDIDYVGVNPTENAELQTCRDYLGKSNTPEARKRWFPEIYGSASATR